mgnify:CR=1 FL=1
MGQKRRGDRGDTDRHLRPARDRGERAGLFHGAADVAEVLEPRGPAARAGRFLLRGTLDQSHERQSSVRGREQQVVCYTKLKPGRQAPAVTRAQLDALLTVAILISARPDRCVLPSGAPPSRRGGSWGNRCGCRRSRCARRPPPGRRAAGRVGSRRSRSRSAFPRPPGRDPRHDRPVHGSGVGALAGGEMDRSIDGGRLDRTPEIERADLAVDGREIRHHAGRDLYP